MGSPLAAHGMEKDPMDATVHQDSRELQNQHNVRGVMNTTIYVTHYHKECRVTRNKWSIDPYRWVDGPL